MDGQFSRVGHVKQGVTKLSRHDGVGQGVFGPKLHSVNERLGLGPTNFVCRENAVSRHQRSVTGHFQSSRQLDQDRCLLPAFPVIRRLKFGARRTLSAPLVVQSIRRPVVVRRPSGPWKLCLSIACSIVKRPRPRCCGDGKVGAQFQCQIQPTFRPILLRCLQAF